MRLPRSLDCSFTDNFFTLPLIPLVEEELLRERERQEEMKRVMCLAYNLDYAEYICVDVVGNLIRPSYVTDHCQVLLKQNGLRRIRFHDLSHICAWNNTFKTNTYIRAHSNKNR